MCCFCVQGEPGEPGVQGVPGPQGPWGLPVSSSKTVGTTRGTNVAHATVPGFQGEDGRDGYGSPGPVGIKVNLLRSDTCSECCNGSFTGITFC